MHYSLRSEWKVKKKEKKKGGPWICPFIQVLMGSILGWETHPPSKFNGNVLRRWEIATLVELTDSNIHGFGFQFRLFLSYFVEFILMCFVMTFSVNSWLFSPLVFVSSSVCPQPSCVSCVLSPVSVLCLHVCSSFSLPSYFCLQFPLFHPFCTLFSLCISV